ncbi:YcnI family copper-binding membrane protein [Solicola gregarius]|uniref:YcnI family protein n=1 Tax=Solicola gregarius TaxID=2908642 RepID=A0AA46YJ57_9ACTN|nr:YcnI family protein [Solicola gregarius]UYM03912.1 YcnI family protein [Solicola gregarius]
MHIIVRRVAAPLIITVGAIALGTVPASAHVEVTPSTTVAGEYALLTFSVPHGCDGSATTEIAIDIPKGIDVVTPTINDGWTIKKQTEPVPGEGTENDRVSRVTYTAKTPLQDGYRDAFELSMPLPTEADTTLRFPTLQTCEKGATNWNEVAKDGQDEEDLEAPAPSFTLTAAEADSAEQASTDATPTDASAAPEETSDDSSDGLSWTALGVGVAGLAVGGVALVRSRTRT